MKLPTRAASLLIARGAFAAGVDVLVLVAITVFFRTVSSNALCVERQ
jgi:hypothetical protein